MIIWHEQRLEGREQMWVSMGRIVQAEKTIRVKTVS